MHDKNLYVLSIILGDEDSGVNKTCFAFKMTA